MCGIVGFFPKENKHNSKKTINEMLLAIKHRGPDQSGIYLDGAIGIGMLRLSIIDREAHDIPYKSPDNSVIVAYNGEIYNHDDIRFFYKGRYDFKTKSDAETVLCHYLNK
jgi:asparagine synthase (glutamine-hydrolysing)